MLKAIENPELEKAELKKVEKVDKKEIEKLIKFIPDYVKIMNKNIQILSYKNKIKTKDRKDTVAGVYLEEFNQIKLWKWKGIRSTFKHETLHACIRAIGYKFFTPAQEEWFVTSLSNLLDSVDSQVAQYVGNNLKPKKKVKKSKPIKLRRKKNVKRK